MCEKGQGCQRPDQLQTTPQECSPEQIHLCHGEASGHPCLTQPGCQDPASLQGTPEDCSPEQVRKCHGDDKGHPCQ